MEKVCPVCHKTFEAKGNNHIYCSLHCRKKHHKMVYYDRERQIPEPDPKKQELRHFWCKKCQKLVIVTSISDRRRKFCSPRCERLYWKHPHKIKKTGRKRKV